MEAEVDDAAKWTALSHSPLEVERMQFWRSTGQEPTDVADGRTDAGADPLRAGRDREDDPQPGRSVPAIGHVPAGRTPPNH